MAPYHYASPPADQRAERKRLAIDLEIVRRIGEVFPLEPAEANYTGEVAERWRYRDGGGEIGVISSVTQPFCGFCSRIRITADGKLRTCLFSKDDHDLRYMVRNGHTDADVHPHFHGYPRPADADEQPDTYRYTYNPANRRGITRGGETKFPIFEQNQLWT